MLPAIGRGHPPRPSVRPLGAGGGRANWLVHHHMAHLSSEMVHRDCDGHHTDDHGGVAAAAGFVDVVIAVVVTAAAIAA